MKSGTASLQRQFILMLIALLLTFFAWMTTRNIHGNIKLQMRQAEIELLTLMDGWHNLLQYTYRMPLNENNAQAVLDEGLILFDLHEENLERSNNAFSNKRLFPDDVTERLEELMAGLALSISLIHEPYEKLALFIEQANATADPLLLETTLYDLYRSIDTKLIDTAKTLPLGWMRQDIRELGYSFNDLLETKQALIRTAIGEATVQRDRRNDQIQTFIIALMSIAIGLFAWRIFMIGRIFIRLIHEQTHELDQALIDLAATQEQLVHSQTLASLGQLSAGISHELNTPLGATGSSIHLIENEVLPQAIAFAAQHLPVPADEDARQFLEDFCLKAKLLGENIPRKDRQALSELWEQAGMDPTTGFFDLFSSPSLYPIGKKMATWGPNLQRDKIIEVTALLARTVDVISIATAKATSVVKALRNHVSGAGGEGEAIVTLQLGIEQALTLLNPRIKKGIEISRYFGENCLVYEKGHQLSQVWLNLLSNAMDAMNDQGKIEIHVETREAKVHVRIIDSGRGIPPQIKGKLFTPYFTTRDTGLGLGLHISRSILENHGGSIAAEEEDGKTCMHVILPRARERHETA